MIYKHENPIHGSSFWTASIAYENVGEAQDNTTFPHGSYNKYFPHLCCKIEDSNKKQMLILTAI